MLRAVEGSCVPHAAAGPVRIDVTGAALHLSAAQKARMVRGVLLALGRFGPRVRRVSVRVAELAGPLGGLDRRCRMHAWLQAGDGIGVEVINGRIEDAVGRAARRLAARVACVLDGGSVGAAHALEGEAFPGGGRLSPGPPPGPRRTRRPGRGVGRA